MDTASHWLKTAALPTYPSLDHALTVDLAIVGGGIAGITAAYLATKAGLSVALLERGRCARIDTGHTTAHLTAVTDLRLHEMDRRFGSTATRAVWDGGMAAIQLIENLVRSEDIACNFQRCDGWLHASTPGENPASLRRDAETAKAIGIDAQFQDSVPFFGVPGVRYPHQALFHPLRYLDGLLRSVTNHGGHVFEQTPVGEISAQQLRTPDGHVNFRHVFIATHNPLMGETGLVRATLFQSKLFLYTSYALGAKVPPGVLPAGSFWDTNDPYNYLRVEPRGGYDYAIYGGEDHKTGQVIETNDGLPFIGENADHQFIATGFAGNGMTFGTLSAMMLLDAISRRTNAWSRIFQPHRAKVIGGTWSYLRENKDFPYRLIRDRLAGAEADSLRDLAPGEGKIVQLNNQKVAAYRNPQGRVSLCSAVCTHMQCIVAWNSAEKTWDCPCHGSRFQPDGHVISGPAEEPLPRLSPITHRRLQPRRGEKVQ